MRDPSACPFPGHHESSGGHGNALALAGPSSVPDAVLSGAALSAAVLPGAVLPGAVLSGAALSAAVLPGAVLPGAVLPGAGKARQAVDGAGSGSRSCQRSCMDCPYSRVRRAGRRIFFGKQHIG
jgi:hypothetical protein